MAIDTVVLKSSYDLMTEGEAIAYSVRKLADDVANGRALKTIKITRFVDSSGYDYLKFNFPVCGNLSSADLMAIYCMMGGFDTFLVGNCERARRDDVIRQTLGARNLHSVPELDVPAFMDIGNAREELSFINTQKRGFSALPEEARSRLVLEMAADQPLLYDVSRQALDLSVDGVDFAINLNAINLMKQRVPLFIRNGYDKVVNSRGEEVVIKENNNFAQTHSSVIANASTFGVLYDRRNGGSYLSIAHLIGGMNIADAARLFARTFARPRDLAAATPELARYFIARRELGRAASYRTLSTVLNIVMSTSTLDDRVHVDATNDDLFACWDVDGWNNDFVGYKNLFDANLDHLEDIMPYAEEVYKVNEALGRAKNAMSANEFTHKYTSLARKIIILVKDKDRLRALGIKDETIDRMQGIGIENMLSSQAAPEREMITDLRRHLREQYLPGFYTNRERYRSSGQDKN
jgi:hypothetical protein